MEDESSHKEEVRSPASKDRRADKLQDRYSKYLFPVVLIIIAWCSKQEVSRVLSERDTAENSRKITVQWKANGDLKDEIKDVKKESEKHEEAGEQRMDFLESSFEKARSRHDCDINKLEKRTYELLKCLK